MKITPAILSNYLMKTFDGLTPIQAWGETSFFYNPDHLRPRGTYFCTLKEKDGENDLASKLSRPGHFRFNFGISKSSFLKLFGKIPARPNKGCVIEGNYAFQQLDLLCPHPVYGWMCWVAIINPSESTLHKIEPLLFECHRLAIEKHLKKPN